jgi:hypothetical protein
LSKSGEYTCANNCQRDCHTRLGAAESTIVGKGSGWDFNNFCNSFCTFNIFMKTCTASIQFYLISNSKNGMKQMIGGGGVGEYLKQMVKIDGRGKMYE